MLVGIDVGTQSLKAVVVDERLRVRGEASISYSVSVPRAGWAEQDPALWLSALRPAIGRALAAADTRPTVVQGLGVAGQLDGCLAVDGAGQALSPCLIWMDRRATLEAARPDAPELRRRTGVLPDAIHMAPKAAWLARHLATAPLRFHQPTSFLVERLCGMAVMDRALASTTMVYDLAAAGFADDLLASFKLKRSALPALASCAERAAPLHAEGAELTGLPQGTLVAVGTGDDFSGAFGGGVTAPGVLACTLGTAEVVGALHPIPVIDAGNLLETHAFPCGGFFLENPGWLCGGAVAWLQTLLRLDDPASLHTLASEAPPGADHLLFLPAMTGAMAPEWDARARGAFYGLSPAHGAAHLARAVLEGCAFAMTDVLARLIALGVRVDTVRLLGGGARSAVWAQIRADVSGLPVEQVDGVDASALGAAACAAVAAGLGPDLVAVIEGAERTVRTVFPTPDGIDFYAGRHAAHGRLFRSLQPMFEAP